MNTNMGTIDRGIRILIALLIVIFYFTGQISGLAALILGIIAITFVVTSAIGICPAYLPFGFSTKEKKGT